MLGKPVDCSVIFVYARKTIVDYSVIFPCVRKTIVDCSVIFVYALKTIFVSLVILPYIWKTIVDCSVIFFCSENHWGLFGNFYVCFEVHCWLLVTPCVSLEYTLLIIECTNSQTYVQRKNYCALPNFFCLSRKPWDLRKEVYWVRSRVPYYFLQLLPEIFFTPI
jgi:hypothetical protein